MTYYSILKLNKLTFFLLLLPQLALAQYGYDSAYLMFPIRPGERNYLAGTMGEIRGTHFHAGIDIRTSGIEGLPVYAVADGYISRVKVSTGGYGNALYLTHPNGLTTVYGHLKSFSKPLADWVREQQYAKQSFDVDLFPARNQFSFRKGEVFAASGNTGGSSGPHLHFEVRDAEQKILDPMRFNFPELIDEAPPLIRKVAFTTMDKQSRVNGQFGRFEFDVTKEGDRFVLHTPLTFEGTIGVEMYAYDRFDGTWSKNGIPCIEVMFDDQKMFSQSITKLSFDEMRNVAVHMNYSEYVTTGQKFTKLWVDDGNWLKVYEAKDWQGLIKVKDQKDHKLEIRTWDSYNNYARFETVIGSKEKNNSTPIKSLSTLRKNGYEVTGNVLEMMNGHSESPQSVLLYTGAKAHEVVPAYQVGTNDFYLWDLRDGLPDSVDLCGTVKRFHFKAMVSPHSDFTHFDQHIDLAVNRYSLFDTLYLAIEQKQDKGDYEIFSIDNRLQPLRRSAKITLKPTVLHDQAKASAYTYSGSGNLGYVGGAWEGNSISFLTTSLGTWTVAYDTVPPTIKPALISKKECRLIIEDNLSGIKSWKGTINGEWVLLNYEYKKKLLWTEKLDADKPFDGEFVVVVTDNAGNETVYTTKI